MQPKFLLVIPVADCQNANKLLVDLQGENLIKVKSCNEIKLSGVLTINQNEFSFNITNYFNSFAIVIEHICEAGNIVKDKLKILKSFQSLLDSRNIFSEDYVDMKDVEAIQGQLCLTE